MLVLARREGQRIRIGPDIVLTVLWSKAGRVRLGIEAPAVVPIFRDELVRRRPRALDLRPG